MGEEVGRPVVRCAAVAALGSAASAALTTVGARRAVGEPATGPSPDDDRGAIGAGRAAGEPGTCSSPDDDGGAAGGRFRVGGRAPADVPSAVGDRLPAGNRCAVGDRLRGDHPSVIGGRPSAGDGGTAGDGSPAGGRLPAEAYAASLACLRGMGPARLAAILRVEPPPAAWRRICRGRGWSEPTVLAALGPRHRRLVVDWSRQARTLDPHDVWQRLVEERLGTATLGSPGYPPSLAADVEPPAILFHRGSPDAIAGARVAIVGTRRCTSTGAGVAFELGRDLADAGVAVVSGLATGIDAAAHRGALAGSGAPPIGVVATGLDVVYPSGHTQLWRDVAAAGVLLSEAPLGCRPERWRFPARNRIVAALADVVVVVESHHRGGSFHTVDEADRRGIDVLAVPGSVRNRAADGTNALLAEGRTPVTGAADVLLALGLQPAGRRCRLDPRPPPHEGDRRLLDVLGWQPATLDQLLLRSGMALGPLVLALDRLAEAGWVCQSGGWYEQVAVGEGGHAP